MSGSAWHFKRFDYLALNALDAEVEIFRQKMADVINFEAEEDFCQDTAEDVGDEVNDFSDVGSENSFIDDQDVITDTNFYRNFENVENNIEQVLMRIMMSLKILKTLMKYQIYVKTLEKNLKLKTTNILKQIFKN